MKKRKDGRYIKVITFNGKRVTFYSRAATEAEAQRDFNKQLLAYKEKEEKGKLFKDVADEWEQEHYPKIAYTTANRYRVLLAHAVDEFGNMYIKDITALDIERHLDAFAAQRYSSKTIKDQLSVVRLVFKYAYIKGYVTVDPTRYITPPKGKPSTPREALTEDEVKTVIDSINCRYGFLPYFLLYTGLRCGEALALQHKDIDIVNREIHVTKSVYHEGNKPRLKTTKTQSGIRDVIIPDVLLDKIPVGKPDEYLFSVDGSRPLSYSAYQRRWNRYREETGLNITAHQLRHTYATILFEAGIDVKDAQHLMGHSDISVTQNIYTHIRANRMHDTANKLNAYTAENLTNI